jgi:hypothetical protein
MRSSQQAGSAPLIVPITELMTVPVGFVNKMSSSLLDWVSCRLEILSMTL